MVPWLAVWYRDVALKFGIVDGIRWGCYVLVGYLMARVKCMQGLSMVVVLDGCACHRGLARLERWLIEGGRLVIYGGAWHKA